MISRLLIVPVIAASGIFGGAPTSHASAAGPGAWVRLARPASLFPDPAPGRPVRRLPSRDREGLPVAVPVLDASGGWLKVAYQGTRGWVPSAATRRASLFKLPAAARAQARRVMRAAGPHSGLLIADSSGRPLMQVRSSRPLILASVTKLFSTSAALDRFGLRLRGELPRILKPSDNVRAQALLNRLGGGSNRLGTRRAMRFAERLDAQVTLRDGSGLNRADRASARSVVNLLVGMRRQRHFRTWKRALPVAGRDGTLAGRMNGSSAAGHCQAKTGTLHDVSSLAGYCTTRKHHRIVFAIVMNRTSAQIARPRQDKILRALTRLG